MSNRAIPVIITATVSGLMALAIANVVPGGATGQAVPSICHVPPGNPEAAVEIPPDSPSYPAHLPGGPGHEGDFLITEGLTCPATVPTLPTLPDTTVGDPVPTDPTTTVTVPATDPPGTNPLTVPTTPTTAGTTPTTAGVTPTTTATVNTVAVLPTGTVAQTTPTLPGTE